MKIEHVRIYNCPTYFISHIYVDVEYVSILRGDMEI